MAKLVSVTKETVVAPKGSARAILDWLDRHPLPDHARRSAAQIDAAIQEERDAWD